MATNGIAIKVENLSKCYQMYDAPRDRLKQFILPRLQRFAGQSPQQYYREFWALKDISFEIRKGETVGIIGRNGSGKSTLLQMICGTLNPTNGCIQTKGRIAALLELGSGFNPEFTGRENVYLNATVLGMNKREIDSCIDDIVAFADIGEFIEQPVKTYSSGMVVRLAFSVSVCISPDILVIDEALAVGDAGFQFKCLERMKRLSERGTTLLFVSHDMGMVKSFCQQVIYLENGQEKMSGQPDAVAEQYFLDVRNEQQRNLSSGFPNFRKISLGDNELPAFGTNQGRIVSAYFLDDKNTKISIGAGECIRIYVETEYESSLQGAAISIFLMDRRMLDLAGNYFFLHPEKVRDGRSVAVTKVEFEANLCPGTYFITLRLDSRGMGKNFLPVEKQPAALSFEVRPYVPNFLGTVDIGMREMGPRTVLPQKLSDRKKKVVALLTVRNEAPYLPRCLEHLNAQGVEVCVIDNDSTDESLEIAKQYMGKGVIRIERQPYKGYFDLVEQLRIKERLAEEIDAEWFIHQDADEIREAPVQFANLQDAITEVDKKGFNTINFDEFVFTPADVMSDNNEPIDYVSEYRCYYYFSPSPLRRVNAWKKGGQPVNLVDSGGHEVIFPDRIIYPENFILRHYIALSYKHLLRKYGQERRYSKNEVNERGWHGARAHFELTRARLPRREELQNLDTDGWNRSRPFDRHIFFGE